ncbi:DUF6385 domain-containing protein [Sinanaerobacter chloroacetimidivorans]|nr:DUF6385 domain-containing protein [Sinanaerobacter chloroacetimidivorans]
MRNPFKEYIFKYIIDDNVSYSHTICTASATMVTVFLKIYGEGSLEASIQNSPDGINFINDIQNLKLEDDEMGTLVPYLYSKYMRIAMKCTKPSTKVKIWFQIQNIM